MKTINASEFKAKCLALLDEVHDTGEVLVIRKHGKTIARVIADGEETERPWMNLRGKGRFIGDPFAPVVKPSEIRVLD